MALALWSVCQLYSHFRGVLHSGFACNRLVNQRGLRGVESLRVLAGCVVQGVLQADPFRETARNREYGAGSAVCVSHGHGGL